MLFGSGCARARVSLELLTSICVQSLQDGDADDDDDVAAADESSDGRCQFPEACALIIPPQ